MFCYKLVMLKAFMVQEPNIITGIHEVFAVFLSIFTEVMHNVQQQLNNMMSVMSSTPASWGKPTYTQ